MGTTRVTSPRSTAGQGSIGLLSCVAFAVGTMVGAGVFVLSGLAVQRAGPAAILSFVLAGVLVLLSALSFAVVASLAPAGGSGYAYVATALGSRFGFLTSWAFWLGGVIGVAFVLNAFGRYLHDFFVSALPATAVAVAAVVLIAVLNLGPASLIGRAETALVAVKVAILALLIVFALVHLDRAHLTPLTPHGTGAVVTTSGLLFIAYLGFNVVTNMAGDVDRPRRTIPLAILISMAIVALIYVGVVVALLAGGISSYDEASVGTAAQHLIGNWGGVLIPIGALISTLSAANANMLGSSEIMVRLAADRQVPTVAGRLWHGHPAVSVLAGAVVSVVLLFTGGIEAIVALGNVAAIVAMVLVNAAAVRAQRDPHAGGVRLPAGPLLPALGLLAALVQLVFIGWWQTLFGLVLVAAGLGLHALRGRHHPGHHATITEHLRRNAGPAGRALRRRTTREV
ncbi:APC family permease [Micromonospora sp. NBC_00898]|uniref:APC family permease n=1 Tax=Micromonospora sp. NBC_00898 TaxID=2975981 RepID=UPI003864DC52|nr:APC family permease [Micromonospora sp. NBC_00898]